MGQVRAPMPPARRAKQFSMFDALKGLKEALAAKEFVPEEKKILTEDAVEELNSKFKQLTPGMVITVIYYCGYSRAYSQITGAVKKIDSYWKSLQIGDVCIGFEEIYDVIV